MKYTFNYKNKNSKPRTEVISASSAEQANLKFRKRHPNAALIETDSSYSKTKSSSQNSLFAFFFQRIAYFIIDNIYFFLGLLITILVSALIFAVSSYFLGHHNYLKSLHEIDPINFNKPNNLNMFLFIFILILGIIAVIIGLIMSIKIQYKHNKKNDVNLSRQ